MRKALLTTLMLCLAGGLYSQGSTLDSLNQLLLVANGDSTEAALHIQIGRSHYQAMNYDSAAFHAKIALRFSESAATESQGVEALQLLAFIWHDGGQHQKAIDYYRLVRKQRESLKLPVDTFFHYINLANCYTFLNSIDTAIQMYDSAHLVLDAEAYEQKATFHRSQAFFYSRQEQYEQALAHRRHNLELALAEGDSAGLLSAYYYMAYDLEEAENYPEAIAYLEKALPLAVNLDNRYMEWHSRACLGICLVENGQYEAGAEQLLKAEPMGQEFGEDLCCGNGAYLAKALYYSDRAEEAAPYIWRAEEQLPGIDNLRDRRNVLQALVDVYQAQQSYDKAYRALQQLEATKDSLARKEHQRDLAEMKVQYQSREQEREIIRQQKKVKRQRWYMMLALSIMVLLGLLAWFYYRDSRNRQKISTLLAEENEQLESLDRLKSRFFANISHEFRTPMTLVLGGIGEALDKARDNVLRAPLEAAQRSGKRLLLLVEELLELSQLEAGKVALQPVKIRINSWLREQVAAYESLCKTKNIALELNSHIPGELLVELDEGKLSKILSNLLSNALKFTPDGGLVKVAIDRVPSAFSTQPSLQLTVSDTGSGISPEDLPHIFDRFYQGGHQQGGSGVGLALSRELARAMGGSLEAQSALEKGSTFSLHVPVQKAEPVHEKEKELSIRQESERLLVEPPPSGKQRPSILVVEDDPDMQAYLYRILEPDFQVAIVPQGRAALSQLEKHHYELVLSDLMMPEMDGFELLRELRSRQAVFSNIPFIMLTARALPEDKLRALQFGVDDYLIKPFRKEELTARLNSLLRNNKQRNHWQGKTIDKPVSSPERKLIRQAEEIILKNMEKSEFRVTDLAKALTQSQRTLERTIKTATGLTPVSYIRELRLQRAYNLLNGHAYHTVAEIAQAVGISNASYFSRVFMERFGIRPTELLRAKRG